MKKSIILLLALAVISVGSVVAKSPAGIFLGIRLQDMSETLAKSLGLPRVNGVLVRDVLLDSPGARAGLIRSDILLRINGTALTSSRDAAKAVAGISPGDPVEIVVQRRGEQLSLTLVSEARRESLNVTSAASATLSFQGLTVASLSPRIRKRYSVPWGTTGLFISRLDPARKRSVGHDLMRGEIIVGVGQERLWMPKQIVSHLRAAKEAGRDHLLLLVWGVGGYRFSLLPVN